MQTSIEWLIEQLVEMDKQLDGRRKNEDATILKINPTKIFEQAKQIHNLEIENTYWNAYKEGQHSGDKTAEEYYQEVFKNK